MLCRSELTEKIVATAESSVTSWAGVAGIESLEESYLPSLNPIS
jgi:hypothetical protein